MKLVEKRGNIWHEHADGAWVVVPTNGFVKTDGRAVMGRGLALQAAKRFPDLPYFLGHRIQKSGNHVTKFLRLNLISFPVKRNWWEDADLELIGQSARELNALVINGPVYLPRVGCGNGKLHWDVVKPILNACLDGRFIVMDIS